MEETTQSTSPEPTWGTLDDMRIKPSAPRTKNNFPSIIYFFWMKYYRKGPFKNLLSIKESKLHAQKFHVWFSIFSLKKAGKCFTHQMFYRGEAIPHDHTFVLAGSSSLQINSKCFSFKNVLKSKLLKIARDGAVHLIWDGCRRLHLAPNCPYKIR